MPYVCGTYHDKIGTMHCLLAFPGEGPKSVAACNSSIHWQIGPGQEGRKCVPPPVEHDTRTEWHVVDAIPGEAFKVKCRKCSRVMRVDRGALTWEAWHQLAREIWSDEIPLTVAELRLGAMGPGK